MQGLLAHARANTVAYVALFVALGGTSYAVTALPTNSVGTKQIVKDAVTGAKVKNRSLSDADLSLAARSALKGGAGVAGATGATGAQGPQGVKGDTGPSTGPAGGALSGSFPNPGIAGGAIGTAALANGAVTTAKQGAVPTVRVFRLADGAVPDGLGSLAAVGWDGLAFDPANMHSIDAGNADIGRRLVAPIAGVYSVTAQISWEADATLATGARVMKLLKNAANDVLAEDRRPSAGTTTTTVQSVATTVQMAPGDFVRVAVAHNAGVPLDVNGDPTIQLSTFTMTWLGP